MSPKWKSLEYHKALWAREPSLRSTTHDKREWRWRPNGERVISKVFRMELGGFCHWRLGSKLHKSSPIAPVENTRVLFVQTMQNKSTFHPSPPHDWSHLKDGGGETAWGGYFHAWGKLLSGGVDAEDKEIWNDAFCDQCRKRINQARLFNWTFLGEPCRRRAGWPSARMWSGRLKGFELKRLVKQIPIHVGVIYRAWFCLSKSPRAPLLVPDLLHEDTRSLTLW